MSRSMGRVLIFIVSYLSSILQALRQRYYRVHLSCPDNVHFLGKIKFYSPKKISIGSGVRFNDGVFLNIGKSLTIEDNVTISANVFITDTTSDVELLPEHVHVRKSVLIKKNAWIGAGAIILQDVTVGEGCVIAAGAVLSQSTGDREVWVGNPARKAGNLK